MGPRSLSFCLTAVAVTTIISETHASHQRLRLLLPPPRPGAMPRLTAGRGGAKAFLAVSLLLAVSGFVLLAARAASHATGLPSSAGAAPDPPAGVGDARFICSFANGDARAAGIEGADGTQSVIVGGRTWWLF